MRALGVKLLVICLTVALGYCDTVYYRTADGSWASMEAPVKDGRLHIEIGPADTPGEAEKMYKDLVQKGLVPEPPAPEE